MHQRRRRPHRKLWIGLAAMPIVGLLANPALGEPGEVPGEQERTQPERPAPSMSRITERKGDPVRQMLQRTRINGARLRLAPAFSVDPLKVDQVRMRYNPAAVNELEINHIAERVHEITPTGKRAGRKYLDEHGNQVDPVQETKKYVHQLLQAPLAQRDAIIERQQTFAEIHRDRGLQNALEKVKQTADRLKWERHYKAVYKNEEVQQLENAKLLVDYVEAVNEVGRKLGDHSAAPLKRLAAFGQQMEADPRYVKLRKFIKDFYQADGGYNLGEAIAELQRMLNWNPKNTSPLNQVPNRHAFNRYARSVLEAADRIVSEPPYQKMLPDEPREVGKVNSVQQMDERTQTYTKELLGQMSDTTDVTGFISKNDAKFAAVIEYLLTVFKEFRDANAPAKIDMGTLPEELGFITAISRLHREWDGKGAGLVQPEILDNHERSRTANITSGINTSLLLSPDLRMDQIVDNDVISGPEENLFVLTGPNRGGKTTYVRQVGQHYWTSHLGMFVPVAKEAENQSAELSLTDKIFTSLSVTDNTRAGESHYSAELRRVAEFMLEDRPTSDTLLLFDEFANGTDQAEGVRATTLVLQNLSKRGATTYLTTHKHEIADKIDQGRKVSEALKANDPSMLPPGIKPEEVVLGGLNLGIGIKEIGNHQIPTYRIKRDARAPSLGHLLAEEKQLTRDTLEHHFFNDLFRTRQLRPGDTRDNVYRQLEQLFAENGSSDD